MNKKALREFNLILFLCFSNAFYANFFGFNFLIDNYMQNAWFPFIIIFIINLLFCFLFKGFNNKFYPLKIVKKNYFIRIITIIYSIVTSLIIIIFSAILTRNYFYYETPAFLFIFITVITSLILSYQGFSSIISTSTIFFSVFIIFYIFPLFFIKEHDYLLLFPFTFNFKEIYKILLMLLFTFDNFIVIYFSPLINNGVKRKHLVISNSILIIYCLHIMIDSLSLLGANYYKNTFMSAFLRWQLFKGDSFLENYDIFLLVLLTIITIYKISVYFNLIRLTLYCKKKKRFGMIFGGLFLILSMFCFHFIDLIQKNLQYVFSLLLIIIFIIYLYFTKKSWEVKYGNKNRTKQSD